MLIIFLICTTGILAIILQATMTPHTVMRVMHQLGKSVIIPCILMN